MFDVSLAVFFIICFVVVIVWWFVLCWWFACVFLFVLIRCFVFLYSHCRLFLSVCTSATCIMRVLPNVNNFWIIKNEFFIKGPKQQKTTKSNTKKTKLDVSTKNIGSGDLPSSRMASPRNSVRNMVLGALRALTGATFMPKMKKRSRAPTVPRFLPNVNFCLNNQRGELPPLGAPRTSQNRTRMGSGNDAKA